jgi:hypothetical protein
LDEDAHIAIIAVFDNQASLSKPAFARIVTWIGFGQRGSAEMASRCCSL